MLHRFRTGVHRRSDRVHGTGEGHESLSAQGHGETNLDQFDLGRLGGGIRGLDDMSDVLLAGAEKVSVNSLAVEKPDIIADGIEIGLAELEVAV